MGQKKDGNFNDLIKIEWTSIDDIRDDIFKQLQNKKKKDATNKCK